MNYSEICSDIMMNYNSDRLPYIIVFGFRLYYSEISSDKVEKTKCQGNFSSVCYVTS